MSVGILLAESLIRMVPCVFLYLLTLRNHLKLSNKRLRSFLLLFLFVTIVTPILCVSLVPDGDWIPYDTFAYFGFVIWCCFYVVDVSFNRILLTFFMIGNYTLCIELIRDSIGIHLDDLVDMWGYFPVSFGDTFPYIIIYTSFYDIIL